MKIFTQVNCGNDYTLIQDVTKKLWLFGNSEGSCMSVLYPDIVGEKSEPKNISPLLDPESKQIVKHIGCGNKFCVITT